MVYCFDDLLAKGCHINHVDSQGEEYQGPVEVIVRDISSSAFYGFT